MNNLKTNFSKFLELYTAHYYYELKDKLPEKEKDKQQLVEHQHEIIRLYVDQQISSIFKRLQKEYDLEYPFALSKIDFTEESTKSHIDILRKKITCRAHLLDEDSNVELTDIDVITNIIMYLSDTNDISEANEILSSLEFVFFKSHKSLNDYTENLLKKLTDRTANINRPYEWDKDIKPKKGDSFETYCKLHDLNIKSAKDKRIAHATYSDKIVAKKIDSPPSEEEKSILYEKLLKTRFNESIRFYNFEYYLKNSDHRTISLNDFSAIIEYEAIKFKEKNKDNIFPYIFSPQNNLVPFTVYLDNISKDVSRSKSSLIEFLCDENFGDNMVMHYSNAFKEKLDEIILSSNAITVSNKYTPSRFLKNTEYYNEFFDTKFNINKFIKLLFKLRNNGFDFLYENDDNISIIILYLLLSDEILCIEKNKAGANSKLLLNDKYVCSYYARYILIELCNLLTDDTSRIKPYSILLMLHSLYKKIEIKKEKTSNGICITLGYSKEKISIVDSFDKTKDIKSIKECDYIKYDAETIYLCLPSFTSSILNKVKRSLDKQEDNCNISFETSTELKEHAEEGTFVTTYPSESQNSDSPANSASIDERISSTQR